MSDNEKPMSNPNEERKDAILLARRILDKPYIDPDGDICLLARQFLRAIERELGSTTRTFPFLCQCCGQPIKSADDYEWHGLGNCVEICSRCNGSGEEPKARDS